MSKLQVSKLVNFVHGSMILTIFDSRYSDGYVAMLTGESSHAEAIIDNFNGGDNDWESVRWGLDYLPWFPLVTSDTVSDLLDKLQQKLNALDNVNELDWQLAVDLIGNRVRDDTHHKLLCTRTPLFESIKNIDSSLINILQEN